MMKLIADSGSTKTDWVLLSDNRVVGKYKTEGINLVLQLRAEIFNLLNNILLPQIKEYKIDGVYFYGAGCTIDKIEILSSLFSELLPDIKEVEIQSDIIGAARALFGEKRGIACILGTGSNSCLYNGRGIEYQIPALGYVLGDEGSGSHLGRMLVADILKEELPASVKEHFFKYYNISITDIIEGVYRKTFGNRFLANFSKYLYINKNQDWAQRILRNSFTSFFIRNVMKYDYHNETVSFVGSISHYYSDVLLSVADELKISVDKIEKSPMDGLIAYHYK